MRTIKLSEAKTHLSRLVEEATAGEAFIIAKVVPLDGPAVGAAGRIGFLDGQISIPDDFDTMGQEEIEHLFGVRP